MKTIKIHKIFTKKSDETWKLNFNWRINNDVDPRDSISHLAIAATEKQMYNITLPYKQLTINYEGYVGYDREHINDNTVSVYNVFQINDEDDSEAFALAYIDFINTHPITFKWRELLSSLNIQYSVDNVLENENGVIINL